MVLTHQLRVVVFVSILNYCVQVHRAKFELVDKAKGDWQVEVRQISERNERKLLDQTNQNWWEEVEQSDGRELGESLTDYVLNTSKTIFFIRNLLKCIWKDVIGCKSFLCT